MLGGIGKKVSKKRAKTHVFIGYAPVAQLDRASVFGTEGCRFEPYRVHLSKALQAKTLELKAPQQIAVELFLFPPLIPPQMRCFL